MSSSSTHVHQRFEDMLCEARALVEEAGWNVFRFHPSTVVLMRDNQLLTITCSDQHQIKKRACTVPLEVSSHGST
jgi:hypothetical protein